MKKDLQTHLISMAILFIGFICCRFVFFDIHHMKDWPLVLFIVSAVILCIAAFFDLKILSFCTSLGYILGFVLGVIFQQDYIYQMVERRNTLWIIWTEALVGCILIGVISEIIKRYKKR